MGGFSILHLVLVLIIILVFFGPSRLPGLGKSLGEAIRGFKKGIDGDEIDVTKRESLNTAQSQNQQGQNQGQTQAQNQTTPPSTSGGDNKPH